MKLLMIDRPISEGSIKSDLKRKNVHIDPIKLEKGDIALFLRENFEEIDEDKIRDIEEKCEGSFVYASFLAEHLQEKGEVGDLKEVLAQRIETYIEDLKSKIGKESDVIKKAICQISLVTPIDWFNKDSEYLEKAIHSKIRYELVDEIFDTATNFTTEFLFYSQQNPRGFLIKPDPVADYLRAEFIKEGQCEGLIRLLVPYMAFRLSLNIITISELNDISEGDLFEILGDIWFELNTSGGKTPEYFLALVLFTGSFENHPFFNLETLNISKWVECYRNISESHPEDKDCLEMLASGLVNATCNYGNAGDFEKMERCLDELRLLHDSHPEYKGVLEPLAMGLVNATSSYENAGDFNKMERCLDELRLLHDSHPEEKDGLVRIAMGLVNATSNYGAVDDFEKMESCLGELRRLHNFHPEEKGILEQLVTGLYNATCHYGTAGDFEKMESCLGELRRLHNSHPEEKGVLEPLAMGLYNATSQYGIAGDFEKMESCLDELRRLHNFHPEEKGVLELLAKGLGNATSHYGITGDIDKMKSCLEELCGLAAAHPGDTEVRKQLAMGLYNATVLSSEMVDFRTLTLLYKVRFDLPDGESKHKNVKKIENLIAKMIKSMIETEYENGDSNLGVFIDKIKSDLEDAEIILLKASEDLPLRTQKSILESLNS